MTNRKPYRVELDVVDSEHVYHYDVNLTDAEVRGLDILAARASYEDNGDVALHVWRRDQ